MIQVETPQVETPQVETPQVETPQVETPQVETPQVETPQVETPQVETPQFKNPFRKPTPETPILPKGDQKQEPQDDPQEVQDPNDPNYPKASLDNQKMIAEMITTAVNFVYTLVVMDIVFSLDEEFTKEEIKSVSVTEEERTRMQKATLRVVQYYNLADKVNPIIGMLFAAGLMYGRSVKDILKLKKQKAKDKKVREKKAQEEHDKMQKKAEKTLKEAVLIDNTIKPMEIKQQPEAEEQKEVIIIEAQEVKPTLLKNTKKGIAKKKTNQKPIVT